jgi:hypothetical protein
MPARGRVEIRQSIVLIAITLLLLAGTAALVRAAVLFSAFARGDPAKVLPAFSLFGSAILVIAGAIASILGTLQFAAAIGLMTHRSWARVVGISATLIAAFFTMPLLPSAPGIAVMVVDALIVGVLVWDIVTDYPDEAESPSWGEFGRPEQ